MVLFGFAGRTRLALLLVTAACTSRSASDGSPPTPGPGLVFSFPRPQQFDVATGTRLAVAFSRPVVDQVRSGCTATGAADASLCLRSRGGVEVPGSVRTIGPEGTALQFRPDDPLAEGTTYDLFADPGLIDPAAVNIAADEPVTSFRTRQTSIRVGAGPTLLTIAGEPASRWRAGAAEPTLLPLVEFSTLRLLFSEPLDESSVILDETVSLRDAGGTPVEARILVDGAHVVIDPLQDLVPDRSYRLSIEPTLVDLGGEPAAADSFELTPAASHVGDDPYPQILDINPGRAEDGSPQPSDISSLDRNSLAVQSTLLGDHTIQIDDGALVAELSHPDLFAREVPIVARAGQCLTAPGVALAFGGEVDLGFGTGDVELCFITDVTGALVRNMHWPADQVPENSEAPLQVLLHADASMSSTEPRGNAGLTQNLLGVELVGVASVVDGRLQVSSIAAMELNLLDAARAPVSAALTMTTAPDRETAADREAPVLLRASAGPAAPLLSDTRSVLLTFSEPVHAGASPATTLHDSLGNEIPIDVKSDGSMLVVSSRVTLAPGESHLLTLGAIYDLAGNRWSTADDDPTAGTAQVAFSTRPHSMSNPSPPLMTAVYPGAPCALTNGAFDTPGHCAGAAPEDAVYQRFALPTNAILEVFFDQPMDPASLALGTSCGSGAIRVERLADGACVEPVAGTLRVFERGFEFVPTGDLVRADSYRLVLHAGGDDGCQPGEVCGANGLPLNPDPLNGAADGAGGPDAVFEFVAAPASDDPYLPTSALPRIDLNGNGSIDDENLAEHGLVGRNRAAVAIGDFSGIVTGADIVEEDCSDSDGDQGCIYLASDLAVTLGESEFDCSIDTGAGTVEVDACLPVHVEASIIYGSSLTLDADVLGLGLINDLETGKVILRVRNDDGPITGWIFEGPDGPELAVELSAYMDAPDLTLLGGLSSHDLHSKELTVPLRGPIDVLEDGRLLLVLANETPVEVEVGFSALGIGVGSMVLEIAAGDMIIGLHSRAPHGWRR